MTIDLEKRTLVNRIIRKLAEQEDSHFDDGVLNYMLKMIEESNSDELGITVEDLVNPEFDE